MDKKKMMKIAFIVIAFFFALALIEASIRGMIVLVNHFSEKNEERKQEDVNFYSDEQKTQRQIIRFIDDIVVAIKDKDDDYVFRYLDKEYKEYIFENDVKKMHDYIKQNINMGEKYDFTRINQSGGMYQVLLGITSGEKFYSQSFTVKVLGTNECSFFFGEYTHFEKKEQVASYPNTKYLITYYYETPDVMSYVLEVENLTNEDITLESTKPSKLISTSGKVYEGTTIEAITIEPYQKNRLEVVFLKQFGGQSTLQLSVTENDIPKEVMLTLVTDMM